MRIDHPYHHPVLLEEVVSLLRPRTGGRYLDGTVGGGGHARALLEASSPEGLLWGLDCDSQAIEAAAKVLRPYGERVELRQSNFRRAHKLFGGMQFDGILLDLGVSSYQIDNSERGFSFDRNGPVDMRMDSRKGPSAMEVLATLDEETLSRLLRTLGEEPNHRRIARAIVRARARAPIETTGQLAEVVRKTVPQRSQRKSVVRTFQALRIHVNDELGALEEALDHLFGMLAPEGRMAVISYHSLEDRLVKKFFVQLADPCICPPDFPVCVCKRMPTARILTRKPVRPGEAELEANARGRSACLRAAEKLAVGEAA